MARSVAIMCYGDEADRLRAAAIARLKKRTTSQWLVELIRAEYRAVYGDLDPEKINAPGK